jgi:hypothetical protein
MIETDCAITFHGRKYEANGAMVTDKWIIAYMSNDMSGITDWHGETLGTAKIKTSWATPTSYMSDRCYQVEATVNGVTYTGRTCGAGMIYKGKVKRS